MSFCFSSLPSSLSSSFRFSHPRIFLIYLSKNDKHMGFSQVHQCSFDVPVMSHCCLIRTLPVGVCTTRPLHLDCFSAFWSEWISQDHLVQFSFTPESAIPSRTPNSFCWKMAFKRYHLELGVFYAIRKHYL